MGGDLTTELKEKKNFRFNYFSIPFLIKYQFSKKFVAFAGPQFDAILYAEKSNKFGEFDITGSAEEFDAHITGGLEYWIGKRYYAQWPVYVRLLRSDILFHLVFQ